MKKRWQEKGRTKYSIKTNKEELLELKQVEMDNEILSALNKFERFSSAKIPTKDRLKK